MIPLENSLAGRVADIHYLLPKYKLQIHGEHFQVVEHNLISRPEAEMKDIKYVRKKNNYLECCGDTYLSGSMLDFYIKKFLT